MGSPLASVLQRAWTIHLPLLMPCHRVRVLVKVLQYSLTRSHRSSALVWWALRISWRISWRVRGKARS